jgi:putative molybdopterin biosynthesis protein
VRLGRVGGALVATPLPRGAGVLTSLVRADGLLVVPAASRGPPRRRAVEVRLLRDLGAVERTIVAIGSHDLVLDLAASVCARATRADARLVARRLARRARRAARRALPLAAATCSTPRAGEYTLP